MRLILFFVFFLSSNVAYSICYYQINNKTIYNERIVNEIVSVSLSKYVEQVNPLPLSGTKSGACVYSISITPDFVTTVNGRKINDSGESELNDLKAVRQSLLRAIYKGIPNQRKILCRDYGDSALY